MKTRQGFVSNSSSSSFIIQANKSSEYKNVWEVAKQMIRDRETNYRRWEEDGEDVKWVDANIIIKQIEELNLELDTPMTMHSTNYETYIYKRDGKIYIDTCNNIEWNLSVNGDNCEFSDGLFYSAEDTISDNNQDYSDVKFFHIDYLVYASEPEWSDQREHKCKCNGYTRLQLNSGQIICPECDKDILEQEKFPPKAIQISEKISRLSIID